MEWLKTLGTEAVAVVVALMIGWLVRGLRVKPQFEALRGQIKQERKETDARFAKLEQDLAATSKADSMLKIAQARKAHEEAIKMEEERRERAWVGAKARVLVDSRG